MKVNELLFEGYIPGWEVPHVKIIKDEPGPTYKYVSPVSQLAGDNPAMKAKLDAKNKPPEHIWQIVWQDQDGDDMFYYSPKWGWIKFREKPENEYSFNSRAEAIDNLEDAYEQMGNI